MPDSKTVCPEGTIGANDRSTEGRVVCLQADETSHIKGIVLKFSERFKYDKILILNFSNLNDRYTFTNLGVSLHLPLEVS